MPDLNKIIEDLSSLTVAEAAELSKQLEEKWGVTPMAAAAPAAAGAAATAAAADTPHFSSNCFDNSAASTTVKLDKSSIILFRSAIIFIQGYFFDFSSAKIAIFEPGASKILAIFCAGDLNIPTIFARASSNVGKVATF